MQENLEKMKNIQNDIIDYIDARDPKEEQRLFDLILLNDIQNDDHLVIELLHMLSSISSNHHRNKYFFTKIEKIILLFKSNIQKMTKHQLYNIFKNNQNILHFLLKEKLLTADQQFISDILSDQPLNFQYYFYPEIKSFIKDENKSDFDFVKKEYDGDPNFFEKSREFGENTNEIAQLIRTDSIEKFVQLETKKVINSSTIIGQSIYETNSFLINKKPTIIEYAAFHGSIQIIRYLRFQNFPLTPSLWLYAVHSNYPDLIHFLEENKVPLIKSSLMECFYESIRCHHNNLANYLNEIYLINYVNNLDFLRVCLSHYNYCFFNDNIYNCGDLIFQYDYYYIASYLLYNKRIKCDSTLLAYAINNDNANLVKLLLESPTIDVNASLKNEQTPLYNAVNNGNIEIVDILLSNPKINLNLTSSIKKEIRAKKDSTNTYKLRSNWGNSYATNDIHYIYEEKTALYLAVEKGHISIAKKLLENKKININIPAQKRNREIYSDQNEIKTVLYLAVEKNEYEIIALLLSNPAINVNDISKTTNKNIIPNDSPLHLAIKKGDVFSVKLLLGQPNIDVNLYNDNGSFKKTPLFLAVEKDNKEIVSILLSHPKININLKAMIKSRYYSEWKKFDNWKTALYVAVERQNEDIVKLLLNSPEIKINQIVVDTSNLTALHCAIQVGNLSILRLLLGNKYIKCNFRLFNCFRQQVEPSKRRKETIDQALLCFAIEKGNLETIQTLLEYSPTCIYDKSFLKTEIFSDIGNKNLRMESITKEEISPILCAIKSGKKDIIQFFLNNQIDVNAKFKIKTKTFDIDQKNSLKIISKTTIECNALQYMILNEFTDKTNGEIFELLINSSRFDINSTFHKKVNIQKRKNEADNKSIPLSETKKSYEHTALSIAIENGKDEMIDILLKNKNIDINHPINCIEKSFEENAVKYIKETKEPVLASAISSKKREIVKKLVGQTTIDINSIYSVEIKKNYFGFNWYQMEIYQKTPFIIAVEVGEIEIINSLLNNNKLDINACLILNTDETNETKDAICIAIENKNPNVVRILANRSDYNFGCYAKNFLKYNDLREHKKHLFVAVENNQYAIAQILLENEKIDVNEKSIVYKMQSDAPFNKTALHVAVEKGYYNLITLLQKNNGQILI